MAKAPGPVVDPTWKLATLTLEPVADLASLRRSTIGGEAPVIMSPTRLHPPPLVEDSKESGSATSPYLVKSANSSEQTLIDSGPKTPDTEPEDMVLDGMVVDAMDPEAQSLLPKENPPSPPPRPPPIPPRPQIGPLNKPDAEKANPEVVSRQAAEQAAQQQDVDEAMGNVLHKLQYSIKGFEKDGKETDAINE
jgi:hypothetical protein